MTLKRATTQELRTVACAGFYELTKDEPLVVPQRGPAARPFTSGPLTVLATEMGSIVLLDAWMQGIGKVASFRADPVTKAFEVVAWKQKALPKWLPILEFELKARLNV